MTVVLTFSTDSLTPAELVQSKIALVNFIVGIEAAWVRADSVSPRRCARESVPDQRRARAL
jgi:hypothetical protein